jgi:putative transposase
LQTGYENFFRKCKEKKKGKKGFPQFKKKFGKQSFRIPQNVFVVDGKLVMPKFLEGIELIQHREIEGEIQFATISQNKAGQYHVSITVEREIQPLPVNDRAVGLDLNIRANMNSDGNAELNPRPTRQYKQRLRLLHQKVARKKDKKSKERAKAKKALAKLYLKIHNKREDHLHKLSKRMIDENQVIVCEDLDVASMLKKIAPEDREMKRWEEKKLHRDIADCGWSSLLQKLKYKAQWYGREFIQVSRWYPSSQLCNHCGWQYKDLPKNCKEWCCWNCWETNQRDCNSAKNILEEGLRIRTSGTEGIAVRSAIRPAISGLVVRTEAPPSLAAG